MTFDIHRYDSVSSTQLTLSSMPFARCGTTIVAKHQTLGRGQRGSSWESAHGQNILVSILVEPLRLPAAELFDLSRVAALSVARTLLSHEIPARIKWANDVFSADSKLAGILVEPTIQNGVAERAVVGIGLNVNQLSFQAPRASSMAAVLGVELDVEDVLSALLSNFSAYYELLMADCRNELRDEYYELLYRRSEVHRWCSEGTIFTAKIVRVDIDGYLILQQSDGSTHKYAFKQVEHLWE